jgi:alkanesulfonate monooxygenase SsuD/methylene tetrahydromethanopterin reductase-like flavin-dependent oxidoreductase (luciferase family)
MWSDNDGPYAGKHYQLAETLNVPPALSKPHPPILIGGGGERKLLRMVAQYADMNNLFSSSPAEVSHKLDVLARHCEEVGRDRAEIRNTTIGRVGPDTDLDEFVATMKETPTSAWNMSSSRSSPMSRRDSPRARSRSSCRGSPSSRANAARVELSRFKGGLDPV